MTTLSPDQPPQSPIDLLVGYYQAASDRLRQIILNPPGRTQSSREFRQGRAAGITQRGGAVQGSFGLIDKGTVQVLARDSFAAQVKAGAADLSAAARSMGATATRLLRATAQHDLGEAEINRILAGGVIDGTPTQTIRELRQSFERVAKNGLVEVIDKNGNPMHFDPGYYARMVAVTRTREASVIARHAQLQEMGLDLVRIIGKNSKNFCTAFVGKVYSLSGTSTKYPANCTKSSSPFVEEMAGDQELAAAGPDPDTGALLNQPAPVAQRLYQDLQLRGVAQRRAEDVAGEITGGGPPAAPPSDVVGKMPDGRPIHEVDGVKWVQEAHTDRAMVRVGVEALDRRWQKEKDT